MGQAHLKLIEILCKKRPFPFIWGGKIFLENEVLKFWGSKARRLKLPNSQVLKIEALNLRRIEDRSSQLQSSKNLKTKTKEVKTPLRLWNWSFKKIWKTWISCNFSRDNFKGSNIRNLYSLHYTKIMKFKFNKLNFLKNLVNNPYFEK